MPRVLRRLLHVVLRGGRLLLLLVLLRWRRRRPVLLLVLLGSRGWAPVGRRLWGSVLRGPIGWGGRGSPVLRMGSGRTVLLRRSGRAVLLGICWRLVLLRRLLILRSPRGCRRRGRGGILRLGDRRRRSRMRPLLLDRGCRVGCGLARPGVHGGGRHLAGQLIRLGLLLLPLKVLQREVRQYMQREGDSVYECQRRQQRREHT